MSSSLQCDDNTQEMLIQALLRIKELVEECERDERVTVVRALQLRTTAIRALYWLERAMTEDRMRRRKEQASETKKSKKGWKKRK